ncbi:hypothetical protein O6H91_01G063100 [Diphasiastrum complanatum]|uniref:Uncharacterized protein n=1 Tax=Diphasiastrum complanatum TaxID=34168 RepID=A0ACC2ERM2_DIPCM|nr:hypothetical protein O6H91_01G063100 [Diphasiastrum complanatum]
MPEESNSERPRARGEQESARLQAMAACITISPPSAISPCSSPTAFLPSFSIGRLSEGPLQLSAYVGFHVDEVRFRSSPLRREWVIYAPSCDKRQPLIKATAAEAPPLALPKQKIRIKLRSYWTPLIEQASKQILDAAQNTNSKTMDPIPSPTKRRIYCVLRSPHVNKDSREHFEIRTHRRLIDIENPTAQTIDALMQLDIPAGVDVEVKL